MVALVAPVDAPPLKPPATGLLAIAQKVPPTGDRWELGFGYCAEGVGSGVYNISACNRAVTGADVGGPSEFDAETVQAAPWDLYAEIEQSTMDAGGVPAMQARAKRKLEAYTSKLLERELWTGEVAAQEDADWDFKNKAFVRNGIDVTPGTTPNAQGAVAILMQALADNGVGQGVVHVTRRTGVLLPDAWTNTDTFSDRGFVVVSGAGYPGTGPGAAPGATPAADTAWLYATTTVAVRVGPIATFPDGADADWQALDRASNNYKFSAQRFGAATWDGPVYACLANLA